ncbi:P-type conjugative transfer protein VirB9 [Xanthomonas arboricola]|uniref:P-type conjugative transfer protein VirB9 n=1 Tax=Xanthomonas arboricola TaxID=56448 RepID=UPI000CEF535A|nr:P-type conjugative transfer protein VirB9 [Xanthomonas arboricola]PPU05582.1 P-type conjugative transfer protein VirB9 [Xanthomonas arboricola]
MRGLLLVSLLFMFGNAMALDVPAGSAADGRVKQIEYNEHDVVAIYSYPGIATQVVLGDGEGVLDMASGFTDGWELVSRRNIIYIKPKSLEVPGDANTAAGFAEPEPGKWDTNLIVTTDRRTYVFQLFLLASRTSSKKLEYDPRMAFRVQFTYPQAAAALAAATQARAVTADRLAAANPVRNLNYTMKAARKSTAIAPTAAYDDGRFTYLEFPPNGELPNVYLVDEDKRESLVNTHMSGDTLVIHRVAPKLMLRLGRQAVAVFNETYDPRGIVSGTGTTVPGVQRVLTVLDKHDAPAPPPMVAQAAQAHQAALARRTEVQSLEAVALAANAPEAGLIASPIERMRITGPSFAAEVSRLPKITLPKIEVPSLEAPWEGRGEATVRSVLEEWGRRAGWTVYYDTQDYYLDSNFRGDGGFLDAVEALLSRYQNAEVPVVACAFTKPATPVLYLTRSTECKSPRR